MSMASALGSSSRLTALTVKPGPLLPLTWLSSAGSFAVGCSLIVRSTTWLSALKTGSREVRSGLTMPVTLSATCSAVESRIPPMSGLVIPSSSLISGSVMALSSVPTGIPSKSMSALIVGSESSVPASCPRVASTLIAPLAALPPSSLILAGRSMTRCTSLSASVNVSLTLPDRAPRASATASVIFEIVSEVSTWVFGSRPLRSEASPPLTIFARSIWMSPLPRSIETMPASSASFSLTTFSTTLLSASRTCTETSAPSPPMLTDASSGMLTLTPTPVRALTRPSSPMTSSRVPPAPSTTSSRAPERSLTAGLETVRMPSATAYSESSASPLLLAVDAIAPSSRLSSSTI